MKILMTFLLSIGILNIAFPQQKQQLSKSELTSLYVNLYKSSEIDSIIWNGNIEQCYSGSLDDILYKKAEDRINFFRIVTGLNKVRLNPKFNQEAQDAALLVKANNTLTHYPNKDMKCYSQSASNGCRKSNLNITNFKSFPQTSFLTAFIEDYGEENYTVGHRKWILYSKLAEFGYGATDKSEALLVVDGVTSDSVTMPEFIAYPWNGYVPVDLVFPKWSFSIPENKAVDFSNTSITMADQNGAVIRSKTLKLGEKSQDNTIVWTAEGLFSDYDIKYGLNKLEKNGFLNKRIKVSIKNVKVDGANRNFEYFIEPIKI